MKRKFYTRPDTLFLIELPLIETREELKKIKAMYQTCDPYFITSGCCKKRRDKFDNLWNKYQKYADSHFLTQIKTNFHQRSWEMYVGNVLLKKGLEIDSKNEGPDFVIVKTTAYIECVAPTKGDPKKADSVPKKVISAPERIYIQDVPFDKMILRITQAIKDKTNQYEKWKEKEWFDSKRPFVIAVNTGDLDYMDNPKMPNVLKALFGFQHLSINTETNKIKYSCRNAIEKSSNKFVPVTCFANSEYDFISGVLFSDKYVLSHPDNMGDDCIFVNNPFAKNPIDKSFVELFMHWTASKKDNQISLDPPQLL